MRRVHIIMLIVGTAAPAAAQSRVYTNADLGKPLARTHTVTAEELAALKTNQFRLPARFDGPTVVIIPSSPEPPFGNVFPPIAPLSSQPWIVVTSSPWQPWPWGFESFSSATIPPTGAVMQSGNQAASGGRRRGRQ